MKACLTALFLGVACFLFQAGAAEPTEAERKVFLETKVKAENGDAKAQFNLASCMAMAKAWWRTKPKR